jgi:hypothetical protein
MYFDIRIDVFRPMLYHGTLVPREPLVYLTVEQNTLIVALLGPKLTIVWIASINLHHHSRSHCLITGKHLAIVTEFASRIIDERFRSNQTF